MARAFPDSEVWRFLALHQSHVEWGGCTLHDLIQPSFSFLVGVALPFSLASRAIAGQSRGRMIAHAFWRAGILVALGIWLRSIGHPQTYFTFEDTLTQIGLGYGFLFLLALRPVRDQWLAVGLILVGYWALFALWPVADGPGAGVKPEWFERHGLTGFAAHWNKNANPAAAFDVWLLNLFPRQAEFVFIRGGYATLSFIPTLATMILGLIAGGVLKADRGGWAKVGWLAAAGVIGLAAGWLLDWLGVCPAVKRVWTPSWVLFSGGWCFVFLAGFYAVNDVIGWRRWAFPLVVVGTNSIAAYCMSNSPVKAEVGKLVRRHFGRVFEAVGPPYETLVHGAATVLVLWLILLWMYRRKVFIKV
jgi:predicted acyltransferase